MCLSEFILICTFWIFNLDVYSIPNVCRPGKSITRMKGRKSRLEKSFSHNIRLGLWCFFRLRFFLFLLNNLNSNCVLTAQQVLNCKLIGHFSMRKRRKKKHSKRALNLEGEWKNFFSALKHKITFSWGQRRKKKVY